jgi:ABC-type sugar transport system ATPase subunit
MMLAGIYQPSGGDITFDGERVNDVEARGRNVGIVFQSYALYPNMSVLENVMFPLRFKKVEPGEAEKRAREIAALVRIDMLLDRRPSQLSGGQQQRVALARALVKRPHLLLLDEPLSNLDAGLRLTMRTEIRRIQRELGVTTILVTHDQIEATTMADRVVVMNGGRVEQEGRADDLYERPCHIVRCQLRRLAADQSVRRAGRGRHAAGPRSANERRRALHKAQWCSVSARDSARRRQRRRGKSECADHRGRADGPRSALHRRQLVRRHPLPRSRRGAAPCRRRRRAARFSAAGALLFDKESGRRLDARIAA